MSDNKLRWFISIGIVLLVVGFCFGMAMYESRIHHCNKCGNEHRNINGSECIPFIIKRIEALEAQHDPTSIPIVSTIESPNGHSRIIWEYRKAL